MSVWLTILSPSCCIYLSVCSIHAQRLTGHNHHALHALKCSTMPPKLDSTHARMHTCTCTQWSTSVCVNSQNKCWTLVDFASLSLSVCPACMSLVCISVCLPVTFSVYLLFTFNLSSDFEQQTLQYRVLSANPVGCDAYFYLNVLTGRVSPARPLYNSGFDNCVVGFSLQNYVRCVCVFVCVCICFSI